MPGRGGRIYAGGMTHSGNDDNLPLAQKVSRQIDDLLGRPLRRSRSNKFIGGVCGGIEEATGFDANVMRILFVALGLVTAGTALLIYLLLWLVIPEA